jgi:uncharacterized OsmC-like protein
LPPAKAVLESGLRFRAESPDGKLIISDMPETMGGGGSAPSPGWLMQAALATCNATTIVSKAARDGIELSTLEVTIDGESDARGLFGIESADSGPLNTKLHVRISGKGVPEEKLLEIQKWSEKHSWVGNAIRQPIPSKSEVEIV